MALQISRQAASLARRRVVNSSVMARGASGPTPVPFVRLAKPTQALPEEHELIWDDGVTPETCLDFDAQHIDTYQGLLQWMGGLGFFVSLGAFMKYVWKPDTLRAPAPREFPYNGLVVELGGNAPADADGDDEE